MGMYEDFPEQELMREDASEPGQFTDEIFKAYVDAVVPRTPFLADEYGRIQYYGALDLYTDEYLIYMLNYSGLPMAEAIAEMLEVAAEYVLSANQQDGVNRMQHRELSVFGSLSPEDRLRLVSFLEQAGAELPGLPQPFAENQDNILSAAYVLNRLTLLGYYSEWSAYGSTRLLSPNQWVMEGFPLSWEQVGYPGPSLGYRALRTDQVQSL